MNKLLSILGIVILVAFSGCIKNDPVLFNETRFVEIDQTTWNANFSVVVLYPYLTRVPTTGRVVGTTAPNGPDSTLRRLSGTIRLRLNLVGTQSTVDQTVTFTTFTRTDTTLAFPATLTAAQAPPTGQTPAAPAASLAVTNAIAGTHYQALTNTVTIPANSSFGYIDIRILNPGATAGQARFLGIELTDNGTVKSSPNYNKIGLLIDQR